MQQDLIPAHAYGCKVLVTEPGVEVLHPETHQAMITSKLVDNTELWTSHILPFVGPGQYIFLAGVSHHMKALYTQYFDTIPAHKLPNVLDTSGNAMEMTKSHTLSSAAFPA